MIRLDACFGDTSCQCLVDGEPIPEASASAYASLLSYVRSPGCGNGNRNNAPHCCGFRECFFHPTFVEIYYWPEEDADTSCLDIIGESVNPWDFGATLTTTTEYGPWHGRPPNWNRIGTYWGCKSNSWIITTAVMTSIHGFTFKSSMYNPWDRNNPCVATSATVEAHNSDISALTALKMRPRSLAQPMNLAANTTSSPLPKVTLDGYTL